MFDCVRSKAIETLTLTLISTGFRRTGPRPVVVQRKARLTVNTVSVVLTSTDFMVSYLVLWQVALVGVTVTFASAKYMYIIKAQSAYIPRS